VPLTLSPTRPHDTADADAWRDAPVACTLGGDEQADRADQWRELLGTAVRRRQITDGLRLTILPSPDLAARIAAAEQDCCAFFAFTSLLAR